MIPEPDFVPTVPALIAAFAQRHGDAEAIVRHGERRTFHQLDRESAQVARALIGQGVAKGSRIAVLAPPGPDFIVAALAVGRIGAMVGPLSTLYQAPELRWILNRGEFEHLIVARSYLRHDYLDRLEQALPGLAGCGKEPLLLEAAPRLRRIHVIGECDRAWAHPFSELLAGDARVSEAMLRAIEALVTPADPFCIIHTSGSTADPKGVIHGHGPVVRHAWFMGGECTPYGRGDRVITTRAMFWVAGFVATLFYALTNGACLITTEDGSPDSVLRLVEEEGATALVGEPGWFDVLRESATLTEAGLDVVRLNMDTAGIARDGRFLSDQLHARVGVPVHYPNPRFARTFGMTETLGGHTSARFDELLPADRPNWQGRAVPGVELRIVDPVTRAELPPGQLGELLVRGYCLMLGLNGRERHETFDQDGFYATGDLCRLDAEGYLLFEARCNEMIKVRGANVAPAEVEMAMNGLMGIEKAGVVGVAQGGDTKLVAAVLMAPGRELDEAEVIEALKRRLSSYKVPRRILALSTQEMPMTGSGKIRKPELSELLAAQV